jgi:diguanylate cyclase (GGDEF)-like protein
VTLGRPRMVWSPFATWAVRAVPSRVVAYLVFVELIALGWGVAALVRSPWNLDGLAVALYLTALAVGFEEGSRHIARLKLRLAINLKQDMTSVWSFAAAVALRSAWMITVLLVIYGYTYFRQHRPAGEALYRRLFNTSNMLVSAFVAKTVFLSVSHRWSAESDRLGFAVAIGAAVLAYAVINRAAASAALLLLGTRLRDLAGSREENLVELATLCLGGLLSVAILHQPLLAVLVLAPMVTMQRGAVVRELEAAATTDAKTGLLNAVAWEHLAQRELARAARDNAAVGFLIIDVDRFKLVNDRYGHLTGDVVLRRIGRALTAGVREYDTVARFGGEEFVAVLPSASVADSLVVAERLRARVNDIWMSMIVDSLDGEDERLAVSIGVAVSPYDGLELPELLHAADSALYEAKSAGRNRVMLAQPNVGGLEAPVTS